MKVSSYRPNRPIILGDFGVERVATLPKRTEAEIIAMQPPSTQKALLRAVEDDEKHFNRPLPDEKDWKRDYKISRKLDPQEVVQYLAARSNRLHSAFYRKDATPLIGGTPEIDQVRRGRAINAFYFTPPAKVTPDEVKAKAVGLVEYKSEPVREVWVKLPWWKALIHRLRGNEIKVDGGET